MMLYARREVTNRSRTRGLRLSTHNQYLGEGQKSGKEKHVIYKKEKEPRTSSA